MKTTTSPRRRQAAIHRALDRVRADCDMGARRASDPVGFVHEFAGVEDRELVALLASSFAFGNVKALRAKIAEALGRIGPDVARASDDRAALTAKLAGFKHRVYQSEDVVLLLVGARALQRRHGTLGRAFEHALASMGTLREALAWFVAEIRKGGLDARAAASSLRGAQHILPNPAGSSAAKRLMLFLRWMIRPADGVDLGLWNVDPALLLIPVDVHVHRLATNLGFTSRKQVDWKTAEEITARLRAFDAKDPVKYDFSLCHLGMLQGCPSKRDDAACEGCGVKAVCKHW